MLFKIKFSGSKNDGGKEKGGEIDVLLKFKQL